MSFFAATADEEQKNQKANPRRMSDTSFEVRRAQPSDESAIEKLIGENFFSNYKKFGVFEIKNLIKNSFLAMVAESPQSGEIMGFAVFHHSPGPILDYSRVNHQKLKPNIPQSNWDKYVKDNFATDAYTPINSLWLVFFMAEPLVKDDIFQEIFSGVFIIHPRVNHILFNIPTSNFPPQVFPIHQNFRKIDRKSTSSANDSSEKYTSECGEQPLYCFSRTNVCPKLKIRQGAPEDSIDLEPLLSLDNLTSRLIDQKYYLANLMETQSSENQVLVAEDPENGELVGLMYIRKGAISFEKLLATYEIQSFSGIFKTKASFLLQQQQERQEKQAQLQKKKVHDEYDDEEEEEEDTEIEKPPEIDDEELAKKMGALELNAIEIYHFYIREEFAERSIDFIEKAFEIFKDEKYCLIQVPFGKDEKPLLHHFNYVKCVEKGHESLALFLLSRDALSSNISVKLISNQQDLNELEKSASFLNLNADETTMNDFYDTFDTNPVEIDDKNPATNKQKSKLSCFVLTNDALGDEIIGIATINEDLDENLLKRNFEVEETIGDSRKEGLAIIKSLFIAAEYRKQATYFISQIMSQASKCCLFFGTNFDSKLPENSLLLQILYYVHPKRHIEIPEERKNELEKLKNSLSISKAATTSSSNLLKTNYDKSDVQKFSSLYYINQSLLSNPKTNIHSRIVIVGASKVGLSVVNSFFNKYTFLNFNNIIIVTPETLGQKRPMHNFFFDDEDFHDKIELTNVVKNPNLTIIQDKLRDIDRYKKNIVCTSGNWVSYDCLILTTSRQYHIPKSIPHDSPWIVNLKNEEEFLNRLKNQSNSRDQNMQIMVYGSTLDTICTVQGLIETCKFPASSITLICPNGKYEIVKDANIEDKINKYLNEMGVNHQNYLKVEEFVISNPTSSKTLEKVIVSNEPAVTRARRARIIKKRQRARMNSVSVGNSASNSTANTPIAKKDPNPQDFLSPNAENFKLSPAPKLLGDNATPLKKLLFNQINQNHSTVNSPANEVAVEEENSEEFVIKKTSIPATLFVNCHTQDIDDGILNAIYQQSLVFDGRLIVDPKFRTTDPFIFAAGPLAKFSRRFGSNVPPFEFYNSAEIGNNLAQSVLGSLQVDPFVDDFYSQMRVLSDKKQSEQKQREKQNFDNSENFKEDNFQNSEHNSSKSSKNSQKKFKTEEEWKQEEESFVSKLVLPKVQGQRIRKCKFPGNLNFFQVNSATYQEEECEKIITDYIPNLKHDKDLLKRFEILGISGPKFKSEQDKVIRENSRYTRIDINKKTGRIESLWYCGLKTAEEYNLAALVNLPATYCNAILSRHQEGLIPDLVSFFRENWAFAIFSDKFQQFSKELANKISNEPDIVKFVSEIVETVMKEKAMNQNLAISTSNPSSATNTKDFASFVSMGFENVDFSDFNILEQPDIKSGFMLSHEKSEKTNENNPEGMRNLRKKEIQKKEEPKTDKITFETKCLIEKELLQFLKKFQEKIGDIPKVYWLYDIPADFDSSSGNENESEQQ